MPSAAAIGEVVHLERAGRPRIGMDGWRSLLLAESWSVDPDGKVYETQAEARREIPRREAFDGGSSSFERAKAEGSTNKDQKAVFDNIIRASDARPAHTVILVLNRCRRQLPLPPGRRPPAAILDPRARAGTGDRTGAPGPSSSGGLEEGLHHAGQNPRLPRGGDRRSKKVTSASSAASGAGGRAAGRRHRRHPALRRLQNLAQFQADKRFTVAIGGTRARGHRRHQQQAQAARRRARAPRARARHRPQAFIDGAMEGSAAHRQPCRAHRHGLRRPHRPERPYDPRRRAC